MKKHIKNPTIHLVTLKSGLLKGFSEGDYDISLEEELKYSDTILVDGKAVDVDKVRAEIRAGLPDELPAKKEEEVKEPEEETVVAEPGILNEAVVNDYLERSSRTVINSLDEDKEKLSDNDLKLLEDYEAKTKNRQKDIIRKVKKKKIRPGIHLK